MSRGGMPAEITPHRSALHPLPGLAAGIPGSCTMQASQQPGGAVSRETEARRVTTGVRRIAGIHYAVGKTAYRPADRQGAIAHGIQGSQATRLKPRWDQRNVRSGGQAVRQIFLIAHPHDDLRRLPGLGCERTFQLRVTLTMQNELDAAA